MGISYPSPRLCHPVFHKRFAKGTEKRLCRLSGAARPGCREYERTRLFQGHDPAAMQRLRCRRCGSRSIARPPDGQLLKAARVCSGRALGRGREGGGSGWTGVMAVDVLPHFRGAGRWNASVTWGPRRAPETSTRPVGPSCQTALPQGSRDIQGLRIKAASCLCPPRRTEAKPAEQHKRGRGQNPASSTHSISCRGWSGSLPPASATAQHRTAWRKTQQSHTQTQLYFSPTTPGEEEKEKPLRKQERPAYTHM